MQFPYYGLFRKGDSAFVTLCTYLQDTILRETRQTPKANYWMTYFSVQSTMVKCTEGECRMVVTRGRMLGKEEMLATAHVVAVM